MSSYMVTGKKEVLICGGSFDPPHFGHLKLLRSALRFLKPWKTHILVSHQTPLKNPSDTSPQDRLKMTQLAVKQTLPSPLQRNLIWDLFEIKNKRKTYTCQTIRHIRRLYPHASLYLLMGSDCLSDFKKWKRWREILKECTLLVGCRPGFASPKSKVLSPKSYKSLIRPRTSDLGPRTLFLPGVFPDISSTQTREIIQNGKIPHAIPKSVWRWIQKRNLYGLHIHLWLRKKLKRDRYLHTLAVARLASQLAERHHQDSRAAHLAGLLHDAGRSFSLRQMADYSRRHTLEVPHQKEVLRRQPILLHAYVSAEIAKKHFSITNSEILNAIKHHTLGSSSMSSLEKVLYVADIASEDRGFPEAKKIRKVAFRDLDQALLEAVQTKIRYVLSAGQWLHPQTILLWNQYKNHR
ncbi:MAG: nicotinate (nicotinamide) nucleotide adenylyltransferase [Elusimicrobia bacterium]|nr:nicotinate (nicotinamide) nucleotide adenylyltransferase [Elusimicrobiota bacterium]